MKPPGTPHPEAPRILGWLRDRQSEMVELAMELARLESPSTVPASQGPVFDLLGEILSKEGYRIRRFRGVSTGGQLYARPDHEWRGRHARQLIVGHIDTVWPLGTVTEMPVVSEAGVIRGPGIFDMKGGLAQMIFALRSIRALGLNPRVTPLVFLNSDEEIGSPESKGRICRLSRCCSRVLVLEPALEKSGKLKTTRRGAGRFSIRVRGKSAHAGMAPEEGASAILELSHVIRALHGLSDPNRGISVNVGEIRGGTRPNVVAAEASAEVDVRAVTRADADRIEERIRGMQEFEPTVRGTSIEVQGGMDRLPMEPTPRNRVLWRAAQEVGGALGLNLEEAMSGGTSDGNFTSLHAATLDGLGSVGDGAHATHEYVEVDRMPERAALLAGILLLPDLTGSDPKDGRRAGSRAGAGGR